jgi:polyisoprenoid-binding protein YceI
MKPLLILITVLTLISFADTKGKYTTKTGKITFFSAAKLENIEAVNNQVVSVLDMNNGQLGFTLLMKAFLFEKALMQEHFNEKYVESDKYPKSSFKGAISSFSSLTFEKGKATAVVVKGELTLHGVTQNIEAAGIITPLDGGKMKAEATFTILLSDFQIKIPSAVKEHISNEIKITVNMLYDTVS